MRPLPYPVTHPNGQVQTHELAHAVDEHGQPLYEVPPSSSLFFIPVKYIWKGLAVIGAGLTIAAIFIELWRL